MCYIENLVMKNCKLVNTTLAFEYSTVDVEIQGGIDSVINPTAGVIRADSIGTLILEKERVNPADTEITCKEIKETRIMLRSKVAVITRNVDVCVVYLVITR